MYDEFETLVADSPDENGTESDVVSTMEETQEDGESETSSGDESSEIETEDVVVEDTVIETESVYESESELGNEDLIVEEETETESDECDLYSDMLSGADVDAIVLAINQQTETIQNGNISICVALGLLLGVVFIQGFRLRRV